MRKIARGVARLYVIRYSIYKMAMACYSTFHTEAGGGLDGCETSRSRSFVRAMLCVLCSGVFCPSVRYTSVLNRDRNGWGREGVCVCCG